MCPLGSDFLVVYQKQEKQWWVMFKSVNSVRGAMDSGERREPAKGPSAKHLNVKISRAVRDLQRIRKSKAESTIFPP